ncbi:hypothetical protein ABZ924_24010 [Streptomyces sp. NPDC046876]|uniref:hypothetical protein n=1 Tax=Streptomyces sp. NPDC046876 TaxID=3155616 RepID=UPI0033CDF0A9
MFKSCNVERDTEDSSSPRGVYGLTVQDTKSALGLPKGAMPLDSGFTGWALPDRAEAKLPAGCASRMGSTAPYITVTLSAPSQAEKKGIMDRDTAIHHSATVIREVAMNLARKTGC